MSLVMRSCLGSFLWSIFQWFYTGGPNCGFTAFPTFGLTAYNRGYGDSKNSHIPFQFRLVHDRAFVGMILFLRHCLQSWIGVEFPFICNDTISDACRFYINMNGTYVGVGMISPYLINISMLVGSIISWGIMWPYLQSKKGIWYDANLQETSLKGLNGYKVTTATLSNHDS